MTKRIIQGLISLFLIMAQIPVFAVTADTGEIYEKISETVIVSADSDKMIKYGRLEKLTENNVNAAYYADEILVVPIRFISETFYGLLEYDSISRKCRVSFDKAVIEYEVGSKAAVISGKETELSIAPFLIDGTTYVPLVDFITALDMGYVTGDNGITVISPINDFDRTYFTAKIFDIIYDIMNAETREDITIYVSTKGTSYGNGTKEKPFDSIYTARDYIRQLKKDGIERRYTVLFEEGTYYLDKTVDFETQDSGTAKNPVEYAAVPGAEVTFSAGYTLDIWEQYDDNIWRVKLPEAKDDCWLLLEGDNVATKAKYPNDGYLQMIGDEPDLKTDSFRYSELPDIKVNSDLQIGFFSGGSTGNWMWNWWYRYIKTFDKENKRIVMSDGSFDDIPSYVLGTGTKYIIYNALELIDVPGEFYYDTLNNYLYYYPHNPSNINEVLIPRTMDMMNFNGTNNDKPVRNITVRDINFDCVDFYGAMYYIDTFDRKTSKHGERPIEGAAIKIDNSVSIHINDCKFTRLANSAILQSDRSVATRVYGCYFKHIGDSVYNAKRYSDFENCYIDNAGFINFTAYAISFGGQCEYARIAHSRITNIRRTGIGMLKAETQGAVVEFNELDNCMWSSQDGAAIYCSDIHGGVQRNNIMRDIDSRYGVMTALYIDDDTWDFKAYNNLVYNMNLEFSHPDEIMAGLSEKSRRNSVYNNIFADLNCGQGMTFNKQSWDTLEQLTNYNNVWYNCYDRERKMFEMYSTAHLHDNMFKNLGGNMFYNDIGVYDLNIRGIESMEEIKQMGDGDLGHKELVGIKPEFMNEAERDYRMRYDSMAYAQGFDNIDISGIGLKEDFKFIPDSMVVDKLFLKEKGSFVDNSTVLLKKGESKSLELLAREKEMQIKFDPDKNYITYTSDCPEVATVSNNGKITGISFGKAHIVVNYDDGSIKKKSDIYVFVDDYAVSEYASADEITEIYVAQSEKFGTTPFMYAKTKLGRVMEINTEKHIFKSLDDKIATVNKNGKIIGKNIGETEVKLVSSVVNASVEPYKIKVNTVKDFYTNLKGDIDANILKVGEKSVIDAVATAKSNGSLEKIPAKFVSENEKVVKVTEDNGVYYVEAVGVGTAMVNALYNSVPGNEMMKKFSFNVVDEIESNYAGLKFSDISTKMLQSGMRHIKDGHITFYTSGVDVYSANDEFTYLHKEVLGDTDIIVTINSVQDINDISTSIGPMFRISNDTNSYTIHYRTRQDGLLLLVYLKYYTNEIVVLNIDLNNQTYVENTSDVIKLMVSQISKCEKPSDINDLFHECIILTELNNLPNGKIDCIKENNNIFGIDFSGDYIDYSLTNEDLESYLTEKDFITVTDVISSVRKAFALAVINDIDISSRSRYNDVLKKYNDIFDLDLENRVYKKNYTNVYQAFSGKKMNSTDDVKKLFGAWIDNLNSKATGNSQGGTGGSSSGGSAKGTSSRNNASVISTVIDSQKTHQVESDKKHMQFNDVDDALWAKEYILKLYEKGIVSGDENGDFNPNASIKREEAVKMIISAFDFSNEKEMTEFEDVEKSAWYYPYVEKAFKSGIINGVNEQNFGTGKNITRAEIAVILYRCLLKQNYEFTDMNKTFTDDIYIPEYAKEAIYSLAQIGIINGNDDGRFKPNNDSTRAEFSKMLAMVMEYKKGGAGNE